MTALAIVTDDRAAGVTWHPLETVTDDRKDGRDVLLWTRAGYPAVCSWDGAWCDAVGHEVHGATHFADVEGPR